MLIEQVLVNTLKTSKDLTCDCGMIKRQRTIFLPIPLISEVTHAKQDVISLNVIFYTSKQQKDSSSSRSAGKHSDGNKISEHLKDPLEIDSRLINILAR